MESEALTNHCMHNSAIPEKQGADSRVPYILNSSHICGGRDRNYFEDRHAIPEVECDGNSTANWDVGTGKHKGFQSK